MLNSCQGREGRHIEPGKTARCVGPLGLFLVLTIADRGFSAPAVIVSASAGLSAGRVSSGSHRRVRSASSDSNQRAPKFPDTLHSQYSTTLICPRINARNAGGTHYQPALRRSYCPAFVAEPSGRAVRLIRRQAGGTLLRTNSPTSGPWSRPPRANVPLTARRAIRMSESAGDITRLLRAAASRQPQDVERLMSALYADMRRLAHAQLSGERANHTLQPTALVHEAYLKLIDQRSTDWNDRLHFLSVASRIMRRILIDYARERGSVKRGGDRQRAAMEFHEIGVPTRDLDLLALDEALHDLATLDERQARVVELRFFGGCTLDEVASLLNVGRRTVDRDWMVAKAWLFHRIAGHCEANDDA